MTEPLKLQYPADHTSITDACAIIDYFGIKSTEYTDCAVLYEVTFDQLRMMYDLGREHGALPERNKV